MNFYRLLFLKKYLYDLVKSQLKCITRKQLAMLATLACPRARAIAFAFSATIFSISIVLNAENDWAWHWLAQRHTHPNHLLPLLLSSLHLAVIHPVRWGHGHGYFWYLYFYLSHSNILIDQRWNKFLFFFFVISL